MVEMVWEGAGEDSLMVEGEVDRSLKAKADSGRVEMVEVDAGRGNGRLVAETEAEIVEVEAEMVEVAVDLSMAEASDSAVSEGAEGAEAVGAEAEAEVEAGAFEAEVEVGATRGNGVRGARTLFAGGRKKVHLGVGAGTAAGTAEVAASAYDLAGGGGSGGGV